MLILAVNGSPHREGNTAMMLKAALEEIKGPGVETGFIQVSEALSGLKQPYCICCSTPCTGKCYRGTQLEEVFNLFRRADGIILGSPVYFGTVSAQLKTLWDKSRLLRKEKVLLNVVGGAVVNGGARFGGQETTLRAMHDMMLVQGMTVVGDGYVEDDAGHQGACAKRPVQEDPQGFARARILGKRILEVARATRELRSFRCKD